MTAQFPALIWWSYCQKPLSCCFSDAVAAPYLCCHELLFSQLDPVPITSTDFMQHIFFCTTHGKHKSHVKISQGPQQFLHLPPTLRWNQPRNNAGFMIHFRVSVASARMFSLVLWRFRHLHHPVSLPCFQDFEPVSSCCVRPMVCELQSSVRLRM